jgi:decaprenylphospho-beta-D-ribofuranose 2-oxidase
LGRSYGDSSNAPIVLQTSYCHHSPEFDAKTGQLTAEAGITLREILKVTVPRGWFLPVTPGTSYVTFGGEITSDVHGKKSPYRWHVWAAREILEHNTWDGRSFNSISSR